MSLRNLVLGSVLLASIVMVSLVPVGLGFEVDVTDSVTRVVDGDTFDTSASGRVRLADVDSPETYEPGFDEATDALAGMIGNREVYLDIDDVSGADRFGRLVCVVYVRYNSSHVLNVNKAMVDQGRAVVSDFTNNEFNPSTWTTYTYYSRTTETPPTTEAPPPTETNPTTQTSPFAWSGLLYVLVAAVIIVVIVAGVLYLGLRRRSNDRGDDISSSLREDLTFRLDSPRQRFSSSPKGLLHSSQ